MADERPPVDGVASVRVLPHEVVVGRALLLRHERRVALGHLDPVKREGLRRVRVGFGGVLYADCLILAERARTPATKLVRLAHDKVLVLSATRPNVHRSHLNRHVVLFEEELGAVLLGVLVVPRRVASVDVLVRGPRPGARDQNRQSPRV